MKYSILKSVACVAMLLLTSFTWAQDIIVTIDAQKIEAKILEVSKTEIKYKEKDNLDGPTFILSTEEISSIVYQNGKVVVYNQKETVETPKTEPQQKSTVSQEESMADMLLLTGATVRVQITELASDHISYILNGKACTVPASQVAKVTFVSSGQVKIYNDPEAGIVSTPKQESVVPAKQEEKTAKKEPSDRIYRDGDEYMYHDTYISKKEVARILQQNNSVAYNEWKKADGMVTGGAICIGVGSGLVLGGIFPLITGNSKATIGMECAALVPLIVGLGVTLGAPAHYTKAVDIYNSKFDHAAIQFQWYVAPNEVGVALAF